MLLLLLLQGLWTTPGTAITGTLDYRHAYIKSYVESHDMCSVLLLPLQELWSAPGTSIIGSLDYRHAYIDMSSMTVAASSFTAAGTTCPGAMGYSFAAGTTDGE